ncbi:MAG TPA: hydrogenase maturation protease [Geothrix sp.]|nr:hydrogenase maturation protease [Geothrix sp.]
MTEARSASRLLVLGIGNTLLGDEGVGVAVVEHLKNHGDPLPGVDLLDGGTGSLVLLEPMREAKRMILVDATADGASPGTIQRLTPRFSSDFPPSLTAHDIGLRDLLDSFYLLGETPDVVLYAISIRFPQEIGLGLSPEVAAAVPEVALRIQHEAEGR